MDPFSHFLLGYLLGFGLWGPNHLQYVVAAAFAGGLPDVDIALFPIAKRVRWLRHRGITHSIVGVTVLAVAGTVLVPPLIGAVFGTGFAQGAWWAYLVSLEVGGLSHVLLDAMDHWSVPIFAPFSEREYSFDADRIMNVGGMAFTVIAYAAMLDERGRAPLWVWEWTSWLLLAAVAVYFGVRLGARYAIERPRRIGGFTSVIPRGNPLRFLLYDEQRTADGRLRFRFVGHDLLRGALGAVETLEVREIPPSTGPVSTPAEAIERSYAPCLAKSWFLGETNRFARARATDGGFEVFWYSLEMGFLGRSAGVVARVGAADGSVAAQNRWRRPERFGPA